ncbi:MAG: hypothetical protein ACPG4X_20405 [Pikeienuella sp.]
MNHSGKEIDGKKAVEFVDGSHKVTLFVEDFVSGAKMRADATDRLKRAAKESDASDVVIAAGVVVVLLP